MREAPEDGTVLTVLAHGDVVYVLAEVEGGAWLRVRSGAREGFVSARYVDRDPAPAPPASGPTGDAGDGIRVYANSQFIGKPIRVDDAFAPELDRLNGRARELGVKIYVTNSFRRATDALRGTVVTPARRSNHLVGHAIDMNLQSESGFFNSGRLARSGLGDLPAEIRSLLEWVRGDDTLRWGGDFRTEDPVHIDDALNVRRPSLWQRKFDELQA